MRLQLHRQGLARREGTSPHISHAWIDEQWEARAGETHEQEAIRGY